MHHLTADIGWSTLVLCAVLLVAAATAFVKWAWFEVRLARRAKGQGPRTSEGWPYW